MDRRSRNHHNCQWCGLGARDGRCSRLCWRRCMVSLIAQNAMAAAIIFSPPAQEPEGSREDDETCQNQGEKPHCDTCGGNNPLEMCSSGNQQNCPCEEQQYPKDTSPNCPAPECSGVDSSLQCTAKV
ncbi:hypothetical protein EJ02DRAFT_507899 [Clathrospora elynae]|uniref:Uncharacterized protein n=1 Tax=Clathrospora elynae TaxID=706981 RepID=A0A6A5T5K4_9PLEO|nr:hypothetical protein EJ02DRAFT_507899 [Clathrospora elynae]